MQIEISHGLLSDILRDKTARGPKIAVLNINSYCNLKCEFCWIHSPLHGEPVEKYAVPLNSIKKILRELKDMGVNKISLSADGEPWMHPDIVEIVDYIKRNNFYLRITTNLNFKDENIRLAFAKADLLDVNLSATSEKLYKMIQAPLNKNSYKNLISNLKIYSNIYKKRGKPDLEINYIITKNNYTYIGNILKLADKLGIPQVRFRVLDTTQYTKKLFLNKEDVASLRKNLGDLLNKDHKARHNLADLYKYLGEKGNVRFNLNRCFIGWLMVSIECNGNIGFCCQHGNLVIGNWKRDKIKDSWYGAKADRLRLKTKYKFDLAKDFWRSCLFCCSEKQNREIDESLSKFNK